VESGGCASLVRRPVAADRLGGVNRNDFDPLPLEGLDHGGIGLELPVRPAAEDEPLRKLVAHIVEILVRERMAVAAPPVADDAVRQDDQVVCVLLAIHDDPPEAVLLEPRHRAKRTLGSAAALVGADVGPPPRLARAVEVASRPGDRRAGVDRADATP
jgi:hypothetical protein